MKRTQLLRIMGAAAILFSAFSPAFAARTTDIIKPGQQGSPTDTSAVYRSRQLLIYQASPHVYQHTSFLKTNDFGLVPSNGMFIVHSNEVVVFDTPADESSSEELIRFIRQKLKANIKAVVPTHFHEDCVGGLEAFNRHHIPVYASNKTLRFLKEKHRDFSRPIKGFDGQLELSVGQHKVYANFFGEGHTRDNIVGYFPLDNVLFGGCLIKEVGASKGNLEDANVDAWAATVEKLQRKHPNPKVVIPGHGKTGDVELLNYTKRLFQ